MTDTAPEREVTSLERGMDVVVVMATNDVFPWQTGPRFPATFIRAPQGPGDTYEVELANGFRVHLNGNGSDFVGIYPDPEGFEEVYRAMQAQKARERRRIPYLGSSFTVGARKLQLSDPPRTPPDSENESQEGGPHG